MSRLDELIEKLCPDGAEFLTLQECTQKVKNIKWKSYSGNDKKYIDLSSVDRDLHCIIKQQTSKVLDFTAFLGLLVSNLLLVQSEFYYFNRAMVSLSWSIVL